MSGWVADPGVAWNILLTARLKDPPPDELLAGRLYRLHADLGWQPPPDLVVESETLPLQQRLAGAAGEITPIVVGRAAADLVIAAHHSRVDGLGLLGVLRSLLEVDVRSSAHGVSERPRASRVRVIASRLAEATFAPPTRVLPTRSSATPDLDTLVTRSVQGTFRTSDLVHAAVLGVTDHNSRWGGSARHVAVAIGASRRLDDLEIADRSALIRLRDLDRITPEEIGERVRRAPLQADLPAMGSAGDRVVRWALRRLSRRLGSTLLVSHLGQVTCPGVRELAFHPVTGGGSGVSLGAVGHGDVTTLALRARGRTHDAEGLGELLEAIGAAVASGRD